jgi:lipopolysaccharide export system permease protein
MILFRYLSREVFSAMAVIALVVFLIATASRLSGYLADAAAGSLSGSLIGYLLLYRLPGFLELILPVSFFLAVMLAHGRLHVDNELQVLKSSGFSEARLIAMTLVQGLLVMLFASLVVFWLRPAAETGIQAVKADQQSMTEFDLLIPGRFQVLSSGSRVTFVQSLSEDQTLQKIFMTEQVKDEDEGTGPVIAIMAKAGEARLDAADNRFLVLKEGYRYRLSTEDQGYQMIAYEEFGQRLPQNDYEIESEAVREQSLASLVGNGSIEAWAEIQWRLALVLMIPVLVLLAVPLGRVEPRDGRFARIAPGVVLCFLFLILLSAARSAVEEGRLPLFPGLLSVHLMFLLLAIALLRGSEQNLFKVMLGSLRRGVNNA